jgi:hypothetical protein
MKTPEDKPSVFTITRRYIAIIRDEITLSDIAELVKLYAADDTTNHAADYIDTNQCFVDAWEAETGESIVFSTKNADMVVMLDRVMYLAVLAYFDLDAINALEAASLKKEKDPRYTILKNKEGERFVKLNPSGQVIPADIAGLCAGPDAWLSEIKCKCRDCGGLFTLRELQGNGRWCEPCQEASIEEGQ